MNMSLTSLRHIHNILREEDVWMCPWPVLTHLLQYCWSCVSLAARSPSNWSCMLKCFLISTLGCVGCELAPSSSWSCTINCWSLSILGSVVGELTPSSSSSCMPNCSLLSIVGTVGCEILSSSSWSCVFNGCSQFTVARPDSGRWGY